MVNIEVLHPQVFLAQTSFRYDGDLCAPHGVLAMNVSPLIVKEGYMGGEVTEAARVGSGRGWYN